MLDRHVLGALRPAIAKAAARLAALGLSANQVTILGFASGLLAALAIAFGHTWLALFPLLVSRALDGIDGELARQTMQTDRGAFLDVGLDFVFYGMVPLAFALADPAANALAAATLLAAFVGTGTTFLAYAVIAEKRGLKSTEYPSKSFYYLGGLTEGTETVLCFVLMCLWPRHFALFAYIYAVLCTLTTATRLWAGWSTFADDAKRRE